MPQPRGTTSFGRGLARPVVFGVETKRRHLGGLETLIERGKGQKRGTTMPSLTGDRILAVNLHTQLKRSREGRLNPRLQRGHHPDSNGRMKVNGVHRCRDHSTSAVALRRDGCTDVNPLQHPPTKGRPQRIAIRGQHELIHGSDRGRSRFGIHAGQAIDFASIRHELPDGWDGWDAWDGQDRQGRQDGCAPGRAGSELSCQEDLAIAPARRGTQLWTLQEVSVPVSP